MTIVNDSILNNDEKFAYILTNSNLQLTAKFVYMAFENREICLDVLGTIKDITGFVEDICLKTKHEDSVIMPYKVQNIRVVVLGVSRINLGQPRRGRGAIESRLSKTKYPQSLR